MPLRPEITVEALKAIQARRRDDPDVRALLWEIRRLHSAVEQANAAVQSRQREELAPVRYVEALQVPRCGLHAHREDGGTATVIGLYLKGADYAAVKVADSAGTETKAGQLRAMADRIAPYGDRSATGRRQSRR